MVQLENYIILKLIIYQVTKYEKKIIKLNLDNLGLLMNIQTQKLGELQKLASMILEAEDQKESFHILMIYYF